MAAKRAKLGSKYRGPPRFTGMTADSSTPLSQDLVSERLFMFVGPLPAHS